MCVPDERWCGDNEEELGMLLLCLPGSTKTVLTGSKPM